MSTTQAPITTRRGPLLDESAKRVGQMWRQEDHDYLAAQLRRIDELAVQVLQRAQRKGAR